MSEKYSIEFDDNDLNFLEKQANNAADEYNKRKLADEQSEQQELAVEQQAEDEYFDPRDANTW